MHGTNMKMVIIVFLIVNRQNQNIDLEMVTFYWLTMYNEEPG